MTRTTTTIAFLLTILLVTGCNETPGLQAERPADASAATDVSNPFFAVSVQQGGRKVKIHEGTVFLSKGPFDLVFALAETDGLFIHASSRPDLANYVAGGGIPEELVPLRPISEFGTSTLTIDAEQWHYWYFFSPKVSKFTEVKAVETRGGDVYACKKSVLRFRHGPTGRAMAFNELPDTMYLVLVKPDWDGTGTRRVSRESETLRVVFR